MRILRTSRAFGIVAFVVGATAPYEAGAAGDKALGEYLSAECVTCHQLSGQFDGIRPIIGWPESLFIAVMDEYRRKKRDNPIMQTIAGRLSDEELAALAAYFGSLKPHPK